jgi:membrane protein implicated in regulation of membrane protease activity
MSMEDLREHGVLLPEREWGEHRLETTVAQGPLLAAFLVAVLAVVAIYLGAGGTWTWIGLVVFLVAIFTVVWICDRAIVRQRERTRRERRAAAEERERGPSDEVD